MNDDYKGALRDAAFGFCVIMGLVILGIALLTVFNLLNR